MPSSRPRTLAPVCVAVLDQLPDPPQTFSAVDVVDALGEVSPTPAPLDAAAVLDALAAHEIISQTKGGRYVVHPEARPM